MIYEYQCDQCKKIIEILESMNYNTKMSCISCKIIMERIISVSSFRLNGVGCYGKGRI
jgi:putative FmdB family regulatory protein